MLEQGRRRLLSLRDVQEQTGLGRTNIYEKIKAGTFPKPIPIGTRGKRFDSFSIDGWVEKTIEGGTL